MRIVLKLAITAGLMMTLGCSDNKAQPFLPPEFNQSDLVDAWRGNLESWLVDNTSAGRPGYTLNNVEVSLILNSEGTYWLDLSQFSDSLEYRYNSRGYWLWDPGIPEEIYFEVYLATSTQIFDPVQGPIMPDTTDGGGDDTGGVQPDTVTFTLGDNTQIEGIFASFLEYNEDQIRLYGFQGLISLGDITLDRY